VNGVTTMVITFSGDCEYRENADFDADYRHTDAHTFLGCDCGDFRYDELNPECPSGMLHIGLEIETEKYHFKDKDWYDAWAEEELGDYNNKTMKPDGSVNGFEFVTQPLTPEFFKNISWEELIDASDDFNHIPYKHLDDGKTSCRAGLHIHIDRRFFINSKGKELKVLVAGFARLLDSDYGWERAGNGRRENYYSIQYKTRYTKPEDRHSNTTISAVVLGKSYSPRGSINMSPGSTIEVRMFESPHTAEELRERAALVIDAARYVKFLHTERMSVIAGTQNTEKFHEWRKIHSNAPSMVAARTVVCAPAIVADASQLEPVA